MKYELYRTHLTGWGIMLGVVLCCACHRDYLSYEVDQRDRVYMTLHDSLEFSFYQRDSTVTDIRICVMGFSRDYDRVIDVELIDSLTTATEGLHYWFKEKAILKAGELETYVPLTFYRKKDPNFNKDKRVAVGIRLKENEYFDLVPGMGTSTFRAIIAGEIIARPVWWNDACLGSFSEVLYKAFMKQYTSLETTNPAVYNTVESDVGIVASNGIRSPYVWILYEYPIVKFVVHPLYDYYQENPNPEVNIPTPKF